MRKRIFSAKSLGNRIAALSRKHRKIDKLIDAEQVRPNPDMMFIRKLKRERLKLRDALVDSKRLARQSNAIDASAS